MLQKKYNPSKKNMKTIVSENLKKFRDSSDYSQLDVAQFLGIERGAYANYESALLKQRPLLGNGAIDKK